MLAALLLCAATVLAAATPGIALAVGDLSDARRQADAAGLATRATVLAQTLADERDTLAVYAAAGRPGAHGSGLPAADRERADRQVRDVTPAAPTALRGTLARLPAVRDAALTGHGGPQAVVTAYQPLIDALGQVTGTVTAPLGRAVDAASAERALLVSALTAGGPQRTLVTAAQAARIQEQAAVAEFRAVAPAGLRGRYDQTVTGPDADRAAHDLDVLLTGTELTPAGRALGASAVNSALTARLNLMRSVEASAAADEAHAAAGHRAHRLTVLELRVALAVLCLLLIAGVLVNLFRGITRPLDSLHRWARSDAESGEGAEVIGDDEFAAVARRVNALTHEAQALRARSLELTAARAAAGDAGAALAAERAALLRAQEDLLRTQEDLLRSRDDLADRLTAATAQNAAQITFVNLSLRTLGLVERQLTLIEGMEEQEQDPDRLEGLFKLDHLATRMRRNSENLLVLTGTEHAHGAAARPIALVDVARAAVSEIERYERVRIDSVPDAMVAGRAADDISHLVAELLDNATAFSDPSAEILLSGWLMETGEVMLSVADTGIGIPAARLDALNELLADPDPAAPGPAAGMGLYVVARLAHRHGVRVQLRPHAQGGTAAVVVLPQLLLPSLDPQAPPVTPPTPSPSPATPLPIPAPRPADHAGPRISDAYGLLSEQGPRIDDAAAPGPGTPGLADGSGAVAPGTPAESGPAGGAGPAGGPGQVGGAGLAGMDALGVVDAGTPRGSGPVEGFARSGGDAAGQGFGVRAAAGDPGPDDAVPAAGNSSAAGLPPLPTRRPAAGGRAPAAGPDAPQAPDHARDGVVPLHAGQDAPADEPARPHGAGGVTPQGLPQRVPRSTALGAGRPAAGAAVRGPVDADRLRARLGGLQQGLQAGRRDAERESGGTTGPVSGPSHVPGEPGQEVASPPASEEATR